MFEWPKKHSEQEIQSTEQNQLNESAIMSSDGNDDDDDYDDDDKQLIVL